VVFSIDHRVTEGSGELMALIVHMIKRAHFASPLVSPKEGEPVLKAIMGSFVDVAAAYSKLRELEVLLSSILDAVSSPQVPLGASSGFLGDPVCVTALASAVRDCPPPQYESVWEMLEEKVLVCHVHSHDGPVGDGDDDGGGAKSNPDVIVCQVQLFETFLQNLTISSTNAAALCARAVMTTKKVGIHPQQLHLIVPEMT